MDPSFPIAGQDYPRTWNEFLDWYADEQCCVKYLERLRWGNGFICPRCKGREEPYRANRGRLLCRICGYQGTVTAGTVFEKTRTPLRSWFAAVWYVTSQKHGVSALGMQRVLGLGSYQTAWAMLHRLRRAMVKVGRDRLSGKVEVDETYVGGRDVGKIRAPHPNSKKSIVAIAVEVIEPKGFGRVRLRRIPEGSEMHLLPFICEFIERGSIVHTDGSAAYRSLNQHGYIHQKTVHLGGSDPAHVTMPAVHRIASLLKRWLLGTHQGSVKAPHLDYYLDEYTFRFNRRTSKSRGLLFYRLLEQAVVTEPISYNEIIEKPD